MTLPIPTPLPPWARVVVRLAPIAWPLIQFLVDYLEDDTDHEVFEWRRLMVKWSNEGSADAKDDAWTTHDFVNITSGNIDATWTDTDYTNVETPFDTMITSLKPKFSANRRVEEYRWYRRRFNAYTESKPYEDSGPPVRVTTKSIVGTATGSIPSQVAMSVTEKTPSPKHWGRFYMPQPDQGSFNSMGLWSNVSVDALATAVQTCYASCASNELYPVVPVTQVDGDPARALLGITKIQVDNVPDVIRRRRPAGTTYRKILPQVPEPSDVVILIPTAAIVAIAGVLGYWLKGYRDKHQ